MAIQFHCSRCQALMQVADEHAGKKARCPKCQTVQVVPEALPAALPVEPAPPPAAKAPPPLPRRDAVSENPMALPVARPVPPEALTAAPLPPVIAREDEEPFGFEDDEQRGRRGPVRVDEPDPPATRGIIGLVAALIFALLALGGSYLWAVLASNDERAIREKIEKKFWDDARKF
jgi:hypothetical protein